MGLFISVFSRQIKKVLSVISFCVYSELSLKISSTRGYLAFKGSNMDTKVKRVKIKAVTKNPLDEKLKAKKAQTFRKFRPKYVRKVVF